MSQTIRALVIMAMVPLSGGAGTMQRAGRFAFGLLIAGLLIVIPALPAAAEATITRDTITLSFSESGLLDDCRPGLTGTIVGTAIVTFQRVDTSLGFHID